VSPKTAESHTVEVEGRRVRLTNLDKVLYPATGFTKGQVLDYYARIAPVMLPHLADRPVTFVRLPDGVGESGFFAKHVPARRPAWVRTEAVAATGSGKEVEYPVVDDLPTLMWAANLAALEFHTPMWRIGDPEHHDLLVLDLDPGAPATILDCVRVARSARDLLRRHGIELRAKTSGKKGLHLFAPLADTSGEQARQLGRTIAAHLETEHPGLAISSMAKENRVGKVFIDWSQNNHAKTTVTPYSLRATSEPGVSTPVAWEELEAARQPSELFFTPSQVLDRVAEHGDLLSGDG
jgi:bifunctional non-homologous end joining protein LigD